MGNEQTLALLAEFQRRAPESARRLLKLLEVLFREADALQQSVELVTRVMSAGLIPGIDPQGAPTPRSTGTPVARDLEAKLCDEGYFEFTFRVDFFVMKKPLRLVTQLGELLNFLTRGAPGRDGLVGWRTEQEVHEFVAGISSTRKPRKYTNELIYRLRQALADIGLDTGMIQRNPALGVRFASEPPKNAARSLNS
jgi:hypothetical protein